MLTIAGGIVLGVIAFFVIAIAGAAIWSFRGMMKVSR
jgi:hypothetical protein